MTHLNQTWFIRARENNGKLDQTYGFGIRYLRDYQKQFYDQGFQLAAPYVANYIPNPFRYQYDLTFFCWLYYYYILEKEIEILRKAKEDDLADQLSQTKTLYGITRRFVFGQIPSCM